MTEWEVRLWLLAAAIIIDAVLGEPDVIWRRIPHPVVVMGAAIGWLDRVMNRDAAHHGHRVIAGVMAALLVLAGGTITGIALGALIGLVPFGGGLEALLVAVMLAGRGLYDHVAAIAEGLTSRGLQGGREAVRHVVGRDPDALDEAGVARAGIESLAENLSDGVIAPALWYAAFGLPGLIACKAVNTADSMIGYRTPRHKAFGAATARLDDLLNWLPARLCGGLIVLSALVSGHDWRMALAAMRADARHHRSVNAGWPEAAMAGALGLALAGPRSYDGSPVEDGMMNSSGRRDAGPVDIRTALKLGVVTLTVFTGLLMVLALTI